MSLLGKNSNLPDDYNAMHSAVLKPMAKAGACVLIVDHLPKNRETRVLGATGTVAKKNTIGGVSLRVAVHDAFTPSKGGTCDLTVIKDRHGGVRQYCPTGQREPFAGRFSMTDNGDALSWSISTPTDAEDAEVALAQSEVTQDDLAAVRSLDPKPESGRDVQRRLHWRNDRAQAAYKAYQDAALMFPGNSGEQAGEQPESVPRSRTPMSGNRGTPSEEGK